LPSVAFGRNSQLVGRPGPLGIPLGRSVRALFYVKTISKFFKEILLTSPPHMC
jgi:hypothetical protein